MMILDCVFILLQKRRIHLQLNGPQIDAHGPPIRAEHDAGDVPKKKDVNSGKQETQCSCRKNKKRRSFQRSGLGPIWAHKGPYGPIRALMGPYGPLWAQFWLSNH